MPGRPQVKSRDCAGEVVAPEMGHEAMNPKAKWIQRHKEWAKTKKVGSSKQCCELDVYPSNKGFAIYVLAAFWQVNLKNSMKCFAKRYPDAAKQVTSMREMQAWAITVQYITKPLIS